MRLFDKFACGVLCDPISAITGGIGIVGNTVSGILGKGAANKAGQIQNQAAQQAATDVTNATNAANPQIGAAAAQGGAGATAAAGAGAAGANEAAHNAGAGVSEATGNANNILQPYQAAGSTAAGQLQTGAQAGGQFNAQPTLADLQIDPGYAFRLQQGQDALLRSGAARGGALGGSAAKDLLNYGQGAASQEYQNAFNRFQTNRQNNFADLLGISNQGQAAGTTQGNNLTASARYGGDTGINAAQYGGNLGANAAQYAGTLGFEGANQMAANSIGTAKTAADYRTGGAAAQAAGIVGGTNALTSGLTGAVNAGSGALTLSSLLKNPAIRPGGLPPGSMPMPLPYTGGAGAPPVIPPYAGGTR